jgi:hypothetical protein
MPPKKTTAPVAAALQPLDTNQETLSPTFQEEEIDQDIRDIEIIHQQVQRKKREDGSTGRSSKEDR